MINNKLEALVAIDAKNGFTYVGKEKSFVGNTSGTGLTEYVVVPTSSLSERGDASYQVRAQETYNACGKSKGPLFLSNVEVKHYIRTAEE